MALYYCSSCGYGTNYNFDKPDKCGKCGKSFSSGFIVEKPIKKSRRPIIEDDVNIDNEDDIVIPEITEADQDDIQVETIKNETKSITVGEIFATQAPELDNIVSGKSAKRVSKKKILNMLKEQGGSLKNISKVHIGKGK